jgi:tetratricopeptide (TPR) repeat protein
MTLPELTKVYHEANEAFIEEDYETAVELYTRTLELNSTNEDQIAPDYQILSKRAMAYIKLNEYEEALKDAIKCIQTGQPDAMSKGYLRKGYSNLFTTSNFESLNLSLG